jgi:arsenate reductase (thioredoxin)
MTERIYNVLFLCSGNSARSIMAESILRKLGQAHFRAFSAGSQPKGFVNKLALKVLQSLDFPTEGLRSKSWDEFAGEGAPVMDFVFTVCDDAAGETCPVWPGHPMTAHWGIDDPTLAEGTEIQMERAFVQSFKYLRNRISIFLALPLSSIDELALGVKLREIGHEEGETARGAENYQVDG